MKFLLRILRTWMAWVLPRPRLVLALTILSALASLGVASQKLGIETDQLELIASNHPLIALTDKLEPYSFGGKTMLTVVIEAPTPHQAIAFQKDLAALIQADHRYFESELHRIDPEFAKHWGLFFADREDLESIRETIRDNGDLIAGFTEHPDVISLLDLMNRKMASRMIGELFTGFLEEGLKDEEQAKEEPMDLGFLIQTLDGMAATLDGTGGYQSPWKSFFNGNGVDLDLEGYFWEGGKRFLLMFVAAQEEEDGFAESQDCMERLRELIRQVQASYPGVQAGVTGQEALNNDEMTTVLDDMSWATWISIGGVLFLMILFFRGLQRPLFEMIALVIGICWTFGWTAIFIGHLNILSVVFAPLLCGLGVDYGIHWFARFEEEERNCGNGDTVSVLWAVTDRSGPGILLAGLSAAFSFLPLILTGFKGLRELGLITGMGILFILIADFTVLPALCLLVKGGRRPCKGNSGRQRENMLQFSRIKARLVVCAAVSLSIVSSLSALHIEFDLNPLRLQAKNAESVVWEKKLVENSQRSLLNGASFATSSEELDRKVKAFEALRSVSEVETIFSFLPKDQEEKIPILRSILSQIPEIRLEGSGGGQTKTSDIIALSEVLERIRFKMQEERAEEWGADRPLVEQMSRVRQLADRILTLLHDPDDGLIERLSEYRSRFRDDLVKTWSFFRGAASAEPMQVKDIPPLLRSWFYHEGEYLIRVYPKESVWEQGTLAPFVKDLQSVDPQVAGDPVSLYVFASAYRRACILASVYALVAVITLLLLTFRSVAPSLLALLPLIAGTLWTIGIMGSIGIPFNLANSIFMPLVVGAGVEYGVVIVQRWREGTVQPGHLPVSTGKGVVLAALTTTLGFGTLMVSHHQGIFSLGFVAWAGSLCVLLAAVVFLPALLAAMRPAQAARFVKEKKKA